MLCLCATLWRLRIITWVEVRPTLYLMMMIIYSCLTRDSRNVSSAWREHWVCMLMRAGVKIRGSGNMKVFLNGNSKGFFTQSFLVSCRCERLRRAALQQWRCVSRSGWRLQLSVSVSVCGKAVPATYVPSHILFFICEAICILWKPSQISFKTDYTYLSQMQFCICSYSHTFY